MSESLLSNDAHSSLDVPVPVRQLRGRQVFDGGGLDSLACWGRLGQEEDARRLHEIFNFQCLKMRALWHTDRLPVSYQ